MGDLDWELDYLATECELFTVLDGQLIKETEWNQPT